MKIFCACCEQWSALSADGGKGQAPRAVCEHCSAPLHAADQYTLCPDCGHHFLSFYETCPLCTSLVAAAPPEDEYAVTSQKRRPRKGSEFYWQIYVDYGPNRGRAPAAPPTAEEPPHPATVPDLANGYGLEGNGSNDRDYAGVNGTGNGYAQAADSNGNGNGNGKANGNGNGKSNGNGHSGRSSDLAISELQTLSLFPEETAALEEAAVEAQAHAGAGNYNEFDYELVQDPSRLAEIAELLKDEKYLGIDTETTGLDPHTSQLLLLQVSTLDKVYIIDCKRLLPLPLKPILEDSRILKVAQNAKFEYEMLKQQVGIELAGMFDTMLAERVLTSGIAREISLKSIAEKYVGAILDKSVRETFYKLSQNGDAYLAPEQLHYAARDAYVMIPIWRQQVPELKKHKLTQVAELEFKCIAAVGDLELAGVQIDEQAWRKILVGVEVQRDQAARELDELLSPASMQATMFGVPSINLNSNVQLIDVFSKLGVDLPDTMESTLVKYDHPGVKKLLEYRSYEKTLSAFGENVLSLINPKTGRVHPDFNQHGADTGRFSCTRPNVQQIPATSDFRKCFVAAPGYKLITCDYSQCELRILAELSGDEGFVHAFKSGGDLHSMTASQMFGVPLEQVQKSQRSAAKAINFGLAYGMGPGGLAPRLGVSLDEAKELISRYFKAYPGVQQWLDKAAKDAVRHGYSLTMIGRKRFYTLPDDSLKRNDLDEWRRQVASIERQAKNSPIQGSNADMTKLALINLRGALRPWDARTVNTVHDEIVVEVRVDQAEEVKHIVEHEMVKAGEAILQTVPVVADASVADYWSK